MKRWLIGSVGLAIGAAACSGSGTDPSLKKDSATLNAGPVPTYDAGTPPGCNLNIAGIPCVPQLPAVQYFGKWDHKTPFYKKTSKRGTTLFMDEPGNSRRFIAVGVDTVTGEFVFQVDGLKGLEQLEFRTEISRETLVLEIQASPLSAFQDLMYSQGPISPPHIGPNGTPDPTYLYNLAKNLDRVLAEE